ncbi:MAG: hypothetical protein COZ29_03145 [Candidatus Moranbacteria bacterium CG_4_10_14_3_um_filter_45_9]|nr:MAG: hypothetical protein AUK19_01155 [Candidatus Moranbacteria bacterium CG2_30_45_14]PIX89842.1 MAG: hypothetical protein COZ29_03145 [Candidatus Moranbacteria bacterium CG_4_10_14_3_um_filter_45_9]PJA85628.1 MAG: hypothetical protein CO143_01345 [Candidatus Moranbacteria bacterium CG_4_9_14_3_um_filter_45_14]
MKKVFGVVGVVMGCVLVFGQTQAQTKLGQGVDDGLAVTFYPVMVKSQKLVAVELITSDKYHGRYIALEQSVMRNDWRPILSMDGNVSNPGKCTVRVREDGYGVDCWLVLESGVFARYANVQTIKEVIATINDFSKNRSKK